MAWWIAVLLVAGLLSGCVDDGGETDGGGPGSGGGGTEEETEGLGELVPFQEDPRETAYANYTVTVDPQDACIPAGCPVWTATGDDENPPVVHVIDLSELLPEGTHAVFEAEATWERSNPVLIAGGMTLQWWGRDTWITAQEGTAGDGETALSGVVSHFGPDAPSLILVAVEPERLHEPVEVQVSVKVDYVDQGVHATHVVGVGLRGERVPVTVHFADGASDVLMQMRASDGSLVAEGAIEHNVTVVVPVPAPDEYLFTFFGNDAPAQIHVPEENLTSTLLTPIDTTERLGDWQEPPPQGELSWTISVDRTPYWVGLAINGLDGRSQNLDVELTVTAPDGTTVVDASIGCQMVCYSYYMPRTGLAAPELEPGDYTFTVQIDTAQGWRMTDVVGLYGE